MMAEEKQKTEMEAVNTVNTAKVTADAENVIDYSSVEDISERINKILDDVSNDRFELCTIVFKFYKENKRNKNKIIELQNKTSLGKEQIRKLKLVGKYCTETSKNCHTSGNYLKLRFEKIYCISQLKNEELCISLENYAIEHDISARLLQKIIKNLNKDSKDIESAHKLAEEQIEKAKYKPKEQVKNQQSELGNSTKELQEVIKQKEKIINEQIKKNKLLEEENKQLKTELEKMKAAQLTAKTQSDSDKPAENPAENNIAEDANNIQESMPVSVGKVSNGTEPTIQNIVDLPNANNTQELASSC